MKGLRKVIVSDGFLAQVCSQGYRIDKPQLVTQGIPRDARLVGVERPATGVRRARPGLMLEHERGGAGLRVTPEGDVPTLALQVQEVVH